MALYKRITVNADTQIFIWKLEESIAELSADLQLSTTCKKRISLLKSEIHRKQFLGIRHLLKEAGIDNSDLYYDKQGKPHLNGNQYISLSHSYDFAGIIISSKPVGIDIEKQRDKILRIANKFTPLKEYRTLANDEAIIRKLTIVWGAKESVYKAMNHSKISFLKHIYVEDFDFEDKKTISQVNFENKISTFETNFFEFEGFTCVYALYSGSNYLQ